MGTFTNIMLALFAIELGLVFFGYTDFPGTSLYQFVISPSTWDFSSFINTIDLAISLASIGGLIVGLITFRFDIVIFAPVAAVLFSFGKGLITLWVEIPQKEIALLIVSPLIIVFIMGLLSWWRGRES